MREPTTSATRCATPRRLSAVIFWIFWLATTVRPAPGESVRLELAPERWRTFDDESPIALDVDGDGRLDRLTPRLLELRRAFIPGATPYPEGGVERYVAFALDTAAGRSLGTVVQFRFGTENGGYASYLLDAIGDADGDRRGDLAFVVGGALPAEAIVLLDRGDRFEARSSGVLRCACALDERLRLVARERGGEPRELGRWDGASGRFVGAEVVWVVGAAALLRGDIGTTSPVVATVQGGTALRRLPSPAGSAPPAGWLPVALDGTSGWISARVVASISPAPDDF